MSEACPCCSKQPYENCCAPYHRREKIASSAEILMRSRYSAYAKGEVDYLMHTTHRENPEYKKNVQAWRKHLAAYCQITQCHHLEILDHQPGEKTSHVTFRAIISQEGSPIVLTEKSRFMKMGQRWLYHSGDAKWDSQPDPASLPPGLALPMGSSPPSGVTTP